MDKIKTNSDPQAKGIIAWKQQPDRERGVLSGCDMAQEWLLPFWWERYSFYNSDPVVFADFGMSQKAKAWCEARGDVIAPFFDATWIRAVPMKLRKQWYWLKNDNPAWKKRAAFFKKTFAMLESPFKTTIWLDLDCEVLSPLDELFAYSSKAPLAISELSSRLISGLFCSSMAHNSGVVVFQHGIEVFIKQAEIILEHNHQFFAEDNVLSYVIDQMNFPLAPLPKTWNWLMATYGMNPFAKIAHWNFASKAYLKEFGGVKPLLDQYLKTLQ